ncbi:MAG TPA: hypothetical protein VIM16_05785 [Mucilaginibacter sp.]|jgi:hypothetical protein
MKHHPNERIVLDRYGSAYETPEHFNKRNDIKYGREISQALKTPSDEDWADVNALVGSHGYEID